MSPTRSLYCVFLISLAANAIASEPVRLRLQFAEGVPLGYRFVSHREIEIHWEAGDATSDAQASVSKMSESLELTFQYQPIGVTAKTHEIAATCTSVSAKRSQLTGDKISSHDVVDALKDRRFRLSVDPNGAIIDHADLAALLRQLGSRAFRRDATQGRIKSPEMIADVWATQWFLWDMLRSAGGNELSVGDQWSSRLSIPTPMVLRKARAVTHTLSGIESTEQGRVAVIECLFSLAKEKAPPTWPIPYAGTFKMSGPFGFLRAFKILSLEGKGEERFNIDRGMTLGFEHRYRVEMSSMAPPGLWKTPRVVMDQTISMKPLP